ncbi:MAG: HI0074 family nucleotidyltransferase substrate-binding subunit [Lachnospiraceae bacterium]|jgi:nucleotidyltransferase substrate binding protein (TIGR01987 family)|nr:HI0074 family nucleotidyltransferase substrate-binding subunit [Lachnospiraceae bacterium]MEE3461768.1 HI0074 family nucleotidyltransferase substrate-binding subunit [Lachnospiraceae bacterium]
MKKLDNFSNSLAVLKKANFDNAENDEIYRTGIIGQFNLSFELSWKALQEILRLHGVEKAGTGSSREIIQLGYKFGFISDPAVWLSMLKGRNNSVHAYDEEVQGHLLLRSHTPAILNFIY